MFIKVVDLTYTNIYYTKYYFMDMMGGGYAWMVSPTDRTVNSPIWNMYKTIIIGRFTNSKTWVHTIWVYNIYIVYVYRKSVYYIILYFYLYHYIITQSHGP